MVANFKKKPVFPDQGLGVGLRPCHYNVFLGEAPPRSVSWVEVISENFMPWKNKMRLESEAVLLKIRQRYPVALHGVSLSVGSQRHFDPGYVTRLKTLVEVIDPLWVSDHLCWTGVGGHNMHDLLPLPYTEEALVAVVRNVERVQDILGRRILLENVSSYLTFAYSPKTEWEFVSAVVNQADCGLLLDVNNIYVNAFNHGFDPLEYLKNVPWNRVGQIHLAGYCDLGNHLIDTHSEKVSQPVWNLMQWVMENRMPVSTMIERDDNIPQWPVLEKELCQLKALRKKLYVKGSVAQNRTEHDPKKHPRQRSSATPLSH